MFRNGCMDYQQPRTGMTPILQFFPQQIPDDFAKSAAPRTSNAWPADTVASSFRGGSIPPMKTKHASKTTPECEPLLTGHRPVTFQFHHPEAEMVAIAGTFNDWHPSATPMVPLGNGHWAKTLELKPGIYEYLFVVDGKWVADPGSAVTVSNPFGGINCCVTVR